MFSFKQQIKRKTTVCVDEGHNQRIRDVEDRINAKIEDVAELSEKIARASEAIVEAFTKEDLKEYRQLMARR